MSAAPRDLTGKYEMVVGLEVHVQLETATKIFCRCSTNFGALPNANTCPVCLGLPGALPVLNERVLELGIRVGLALNCRIESVSVFARKNYFYPDLPKGYQISQFDKPLALDGCVEIGRRHDGSSIEIGVTRVHLEEDAGKLVHDRFAGFTGVDLNRAGVPLAEIVSEPEMRGSDEAVAYLHTLKQILEYIGVSDVNMEEGSLRVDANISAREVGESKLGTKTELKNLNSFSGVARALEVEFARQCAVLEAGGRIEQQTMLWDANTGQVRPARGKEGSHDYRYFPEPDLPPLLVPVERVDQIKRALPELPDARRARYRKEFNALTDYDIEVLTASAALGSYFETVAHTSNDAKAAANWVMGEVMAALKAGDQSVERFSISAVDLAALLTLVRDGVVSHSAAKQIFAIMLERGGTPARIAEHEGLLKVSDDRALVAWIDAVFAEFPDESARFVAGEKRLQGVLVGHVMKRSKGSADPKRVNQLLGERAGV